MSKLKLKIYTISLTATVLFSISIMSINHLSNQPKQLSIKQQYEIYSIVNRCYDKCSSNIHPNYKSISVDESIEQKIDGLITVAKRKQKEDELAEEARIAESIEIEKQRVARVEAEAERIRLAEIERVRVAEVEKARLAKLEVERLKRQEEKKKQAETQVVSRGSEYKGVNEDVGTFNVSWYGANCTGCSGISASGISVKDSIYYKGYGVAASDWSVLPVYSIIEVEGYGRYIILDRGGAIKGHRLDLLTTSEAKSNEYGRQQLKVTVLKWGK